GLFRLDNATSPALATVRFVMDSPRSVERNLSAVLAVSATGTEAQWAALKDSKVFALVLGNGPDALRVINPDFTLRTPTSDPSLPQVIERLQLAVDRAFAPGLITVTFSNGAFQFVSTTGQSLNIATGPLATSLFAPPTQAGAHFNLNAQGNPDRTRPDAL